MSTRERASAYMHIFRPLDRFSSATTSGRQHICKKELHLQKIEQPAALIQGCIHKTGRCRAAKTNRSTVSSLQLAVAEAQPMILAAATLTFLSYIRAQLATPLGHRIVELCGGGRLGGGRRFAGKHGALDNL
mmetsp:Transcript_34981/g.51229  ORF Transcript_34981/g.51229 Transcript_34981/m.51229 type:complete len:132 (+) Transcript_34981:451-846(+)